jgi:chromosome segregation protein
MPDLGARILSDPNKLWRQLGGFATFCLTVFKLERVEILGFKSFYEKVDLAFPGAVTAVVGPNGCGKSNICDAVAWALGEQSAKILRGERMDDVIFNGSAKRRPLGMAEVILTLSSRPGGNGNGNGNGHGETEGSSASESSDLSEPELLRIGRRVYREGQGEYFLNDKQVRLKDIQDRLLGTGLGVRAYSVIEQGRIDQVLSTKPQDRRRLIEEAAGITKYKLKRRLAETKLEETKGNLLRLSDIIAEIERNVSSLKRQASRAARYKEKSQELRGKRATLARAGHDRLLETASQARRVREERRDREAQAAAALGRAEAELATARLAASEASELRDGTRETVLGLESAIQRDDAQLEANRRAAADLAERRAALEREERDASSEQERTGRELAEHEERLQRAILEARSRSEAREHADHKAAAAAAALAALERNLEAARSDSLAAAGERVAVRNALHELEVEASRLAASLARLAETREKVSRDMAERLEDLEGAQREVERHGEESRAASLGVQEIEQGLARAAAALAQTEPERDQAREASGAAEHRRDALAEILRGRERTVEALRASLAAAGVSESGKLSDRIRPARGWEETVDLLLGEDLDALLATGGPERALEASREFARASFVRTDWKGAAGPPPAEPAPDWRGWETVLENFDELSSAERAALPAAGFVETIGDALALAQCFPERTFVTRRRELVRGSLVCRVSAPPAAGGLFAIRRDIAELDRQAAVLREGLFALDRSLDDGRRARQELEGQLPQLRQREREANALLSDLSARFDERRAERDRLDKERETLETESAALESEAQRLARQRGELQEQERQRAVRESETRARADSLAAGLPETRAAATAAAEDLAHRRTEAEVAAERRRSLEAARDKLVEGRGALERRLGEASQEDHRLAERQDELVREERVTRERRSQNLRTRDARATELDSAASAAAEATARAVRDEDATRARRGELDLAREARFEAEVAETKANGDLEHLIAKTREEFGVAPAELPPAPDTAPEALAALEAEAAELAASIERMGPVNVLAYEEHEEESKRLTFLSTQRDDLVKSVAELQESIRKINATSSQRFREAFEAINENFKAMFARLFQGGVAAMHLLDENDLLESGVEIAAQPPGKRNQSILLLSGGEKALTAIALLMAIFRYKPSPFCILDEVDAPLDEANIDRFTKLLRDMTEETQFIAITHNKRTMETADILYGVTMEEPGCSKIVSVKFD